MPSKRQIIERMFDAIDSRRFDALEQLFAPGCRYERPGYPPIEGAAALLHFYEHERVIASGAHTIQKLVEADGQAAVAGAFQGTLRDGSATALEFADHYGFESDRIAWRKSYFFTPLV